MKKIIRLTESDLTRIVKRVISESDYNLLLEQVQLVDAAVKALNDEASKYKCTFASMQFYPTISVGYVDANYPLKAGAEFRQGKGGVERGYNTVTKEYIYGTDTKQQSGPGSQPTHIYKIDPSNTLTSPPRVINTGYQFTGTKHSAFAELISNKTNIYGLYGNGMEAIYNASDLKTKIKNFYGLFYNAGSTFTGVKGSEFRKPLTDTTKFNPLIDTIVNELAKVRIMVKHTGLYGTGKVDPIGIFQG